MARRFLDSASRVRVNSFSSASSAPARRRSSSTDGRHGPLARDRPRPCARGRSAATCSRGRAGRSLTESSADRRRPPPSPRRAAGARRRAARAKSPAGRPSAAPWRRGGSGGACAAPRSAPRRPEQRDLVALRRAAERGDAPAFSRRHRMRGPGERAGVRLRRALVLGRDDDRREPPERRQAADSAAARSPARKSARRRPRPAPGSPDGPAARSATARGLRARARPARPVAWRRSWKVRSAARGSALARPTSASTTQTKVSSGKLWPLATSCVPMTRSNSPRAAASSWRRRVSIPPGKSDDSVSVRASGKSSAASSARRSTPGPQAVRLSTSWHSGQSLGLGSTWPQWWQTSAARKRCSTSHAEQLGHSKRWPQERQRVSGA